MILWSAFGFSAAHKKAGKLLYGQKKSGKAHRPLEFWQKNGVADPPSYKTTAGQAGFLGHTQGRYARSEPERRRLRRSRATSHKHRRAQAGKPACRHGVRDLYGFLFLSRKVSLYGQKKIRQATSPSGI